MMKSFNRFFHWVIATSILTTSCGSGESDNSDGDEPDVPAITSAQTVNVTVLDYSPAPGQFINQIPEYAEGDTHETMCMKATESLNNGDMISLGAWGGSITLKLSAPISNITDRTDFRITGNGVYAGTTSGDIKYGSSEPGIVMVMQDTNSNGIADDEWYELKGSETFNSTNGYTVTYYQPIENATAENYIYWEASNGDTGYINNSGHHEQSFFPLWIKDSNTLTFSGRRLPDNGHYNLATQKYDLWCYDGYADSHPNNTESSCLDIANAIDRQGNSVHLDSIDFIKIYTGVLQSNGPLGECSTEIAKIEKLIYNN